MNYFNPETTSPSAPLPELRCRPATWRRLLRSLRERGGYVRESGAFLLGRRAEGGGGLITSFLLYDDLDPLALHAGYVHLDGRHFGRLWDICGELGVTVVADVHTHPGGCGQSPSDQANPIVARAGHLAVIVPYFARPPVCRDTLGIYEYRGGGQWRTLPNDRSHSCLKVTK